MDDDDQTACAVYIVISNLFNDNKEARAIHLSNEFHTPAQGDSSITDYCQRIKTLADSLRDVDRAILETQLILNLISDLNPMFSITADHITHTTPFHTFSKVHSMLTLKQSMIANESKVASETALVSTASTPSVLLAGASGTSVCMTTGMVVAVAIVGVDAKTTVVVAGTIMAAAMAATTTRRALRRRHKGPGSTSTPTPRHPLHGVALHPMVLAF
jgi:hypothetical protein